MEIVLIGCEANSGTRDGFESITDTENKCQYCQKLTATGDVISAVSGNPAAIGYASVKDTVKAVTVDGVAPSESTIKDGTYKIQRPFVFVTKSDKELSETAQEFYDFCCIFRCLDIKMYKNRYRCSDNRKSDSECLKKQYHSVFIAPFRLE